MVRCKFTCVSEKKRKEYTGRFLFDYEFQPVQSGSEENKQFFAYTPCGRIEFSSISQGQFEVGKEYYFDITEAVPVQKEN